MIEPAEIWFLRSGRKRRGRGFAMETHPETGCIKINARPPFRQPIWITVEEIEAGKIQQAKSDLTPMR